MLVGHRAGNPDTWAENDGRSPTIAFPLDQKIPFRIYFALTRTAASVPQRLLKPRREQGIFRTVEAVPVMYPVDTRTLSGHNKFVISTGAYPDFLPLSTGQGRVCAFL
jgi:hypothetical protein